MGIFGIFKRKSESDLEAQRRQFLKKSGRIVDGRIIDTDFNEAGEEIAYYFYTVSGVDYESSEILTDEQKSDPLAYAPGAHVGVRYDPRNHGNSILD